MSHFGRWTLALVIVVASGTPARPADEKMVPGEGAIEVMLLRQKSVQEDLKLTSDEAKQIHAFTTKQHKKAEAIEQGSESDRGQKYHELTRENEKFVTEILEPAQLKRLHQIMLQKAGLMMVTQPKVAAALNLTEGQKEKAHEFQQEAHKEWVELHHDTSKESRGEKLHMHQVNSRKRLMSLLTDEQEAKYKEMSGTPFEGKIEYHGDPESK